MTEGQGLTENQLRQSFSAINEIQQALVILSKVCVFYTANDLAPELKENLWILCGDIRNTLYWLSNQIPLYGKQLDELEKLEAMFKYEPQNKGG